MEDKVCDLGPVPFNPCEDSVVVGGSGSGGCGSCGNGEEGEEGEEEEKEEV